MKKVLLSLAVAAFLVSCGGAESAETSALDALKETAETVTEEVNKEVNKEVNEVVNEVVNKVIAEADSSTQEEADTNEVAPDLTDDQPTAE